MRKTWFSRARVVLHSFYVQLPPIRKFEKVKFSALIGPNLTLYERVGPNREKIWCSSAEISITQFL